ncbi:MAG TPA: UDP-glucose/GDP-mannose dehydrogenase family protein [Acidobacteriaceae bacterium]|nr:UDP-glucose/GDP-mannose dehydrogenase family protein [Acidobacteriaceae bacterium]
MIKPVRIAVVGSGYVGLVAAAGFAEIGHEVVCVDNDERKVHALQSGEIPIHEEHLPELLKRHGNARVRFTTDLAEATRFCEALFIAVGTPQSDTGDADLSYVEAVAAEIARTIEHYTVLVEKSTVPVYTNEWIRKTIQRNGVAGGLFDVVSNPEFLREGTAVTDFLHPSRIVIGANSSRAAALMQRIYEPLTLGQYYLRPDCIPGSCSAENPAPLLMTSPRSAEIIKHASNAFLAMKISFVNSVANLCEAAEANVEEVARGIGMDPRIGHRFLNPGIGYGGSCFPKDVAAFRQVATHLGVDFGLLDEVARVNEKQQCRFFEKVKSALWNLRGKKLGVLGLAFKCDTDDIRESPAVALVQRLLAEGASIAAYDPAAMQRTAEIIPAGRAMRYAKDPYDAANLADAVLVLTDWQEFAELDLKKLHSVMKYPLLLDGRNLFPPEKMRGYGFTYFSVGRAPVPPEPADALAVAV